MTEGRQAVRSPRSRRRWAVAAGVAASWVVLELMTGSMISATLILVTIAVLGVACVGGLRALGITRDHPWIQRIAARPWRDGQDVLQVAMRHLSEVFVVTPSGALLAPNVVELRLNPEDLDSLHERMEPAVINASITEVYADQVAARGARFAGLERAEVYVIADESVPPGRYRLRQGTPVGSGQPYSQEFAYAGQEHVHADSGGWSWHEADQGSTVYGGGMTTVMESSVAPVPVLRLVTGSSVAQTAMSGARAGRGPVELALPDVPTVSREHATFTYSDGRWWITNQGRNGLTLNGAAVVGEQPVSDGDEIRWGTMRDALVSRVEIG